MGNSQPPSLDRDKQEIYDKFRQELIKHKDFCTLVQPQSPFILTIKDNDLHVMYNDGTKLTFPLIATEELYWAMIRCISVLREGLKTNNLLIMRRQIRKTMKTRMTYDVYDAILEPMILHNLYLINLQFIRENTGSWYCDDCQFSISKDLLISVQSFHNEISMKLKPESTNINDYAFAIMIREKLNGASLDKFTDWYEKHMIIRDFMIKNHKLYHEFNTTIGKITVKRQWFQFELNAKEIHFANIQLLDEIIANI